MCKSQAEGGQRCATHTRIAYDNKMAEIVGRGSYLGSDAENLVKAATLYATTKKGIAVIEADLERFSEGSNIALIDDLTRALAAGKEQRAITKEVEHQIAIAKIRAIASQAEATQEVEYYEDEDALEPATQNDIVREEVGGLQTLLSNPFQYSELWNIGLESQVEDLYALRARLEAKSN